MSRATISSSTAAASSGAGARICIDRHCTRTRRIGAGSATIRAWSVSTRIALATALTAAGILFGAALAPAAGDRHATGSSAAGVTYTADGVPMVDSGHQCRAGKDGSKRHHDAVDASDF